MKKRYAYALAAGLAIGNLFGVAAQAQTQTQAQSEPDPTEIWKTDPFACLKNSKGVTTYCPNTAGRFLAVRSALKDMQWADASNFMEQLTQVDTTTPAIQELALRASMLSGRYDLSEAHLAKLNALDPGNPLAALAAAAALVKSGDADKAIETLEGARKDNSIDSLLARLALRFYRQGQYDKEAGESDTDIFSSAIYEAFNYGLVESLQELVTQGKYSEARGFAAQMPQYEVLTLELSAHLNPQDTSPLHVLYAGAKRRGDYEAALHYLDRFSYGDHTPGVFRAAAEILVLMNEKPAALQNLKAGAAYFTRKESDGKTLTEADRLMRRLIGEDIEKLEKELAPAAPKPAAP